MPELNPRDKAEALWKSIQLMEANKAQVDLGDYHLHVLREMHAEAVAEARQ
jgi:hypothetical protein